MRNISLNEIFVIRLKEVLGSRSAYWLAKTSGVSNATISRVFSGEMNPTLEMVEKIAKGLMVKPTDLLMDKSAELERIPSDLASMLSDQDELIYEAIRGMLKPILKRQGKQ